MRGLISGRAAIAAHVEGVRVEGRGHLKLDSGVKECLDNHFSVGLANLPLSLTASPTKET